MNQPDNLHIINELRVPELATAIDQWLAARDQFKIEPSDENLSDYDATLHDLGAAWNERYPDDADTPEAFQWYRLGLIAPEDE
jgi:hypothetical protein